jgi:hypothetical protein
MTHQTPNHCVMQGRGGYSETDYAASVEKVAGAVRHLSMIKALAAIGASFMRHG